MSGYHQMLLTEEASEVTAFRANGELYQWVVAPMGLASMSRRRGRVQYLVQWADLPASENSWEFATDINHG
ncbi:hypothetical protein PI124_g3924 [Phytophthora idaei]|nr:hypothetical protein PI125_g3352 [Phytophthora idaei]KAG3251448.1 hypothetical protein PI124_g3924 [Phytophthora idaei]